MSTPFTDPYSETASLQDLLDELVLAYSERRQVLKQDAYEPEDDRDVQDKDYWQTLQKWITDNCGNYIDHVNGPITEDNQNIRYWTLPSLLEAAGLNTAGFRRATSWDGETEPEWQYGFMQEGDYIGPWIIDDLQKLFSLLKWTFPSPMTLNNYGLPESARGAIFDVNRATAEDAAWVQFQTKTVAARYNIGQRSDSYPVYPEDPERDDWYAELNEKVCVIQDFDLDNYGYSADIYDLFDEPEACVCFDALTWEGAPTTFHVFGNSYVEGMNRLGITEYEIPNIKLAGPAWPDGITIFRWGYELNQTKSGWIAKWNFTNCNEV